MKDRCVYYDDGVGNGGYCSGMNASPPSCKFPKNNLNYYPKCNGEFKKCDLDKGDIAEKNTLAIKKLHKQIDKLL